MPHIYLTDYVGAGTFLNPYRPRASDQEGWASIDLRPDPTVTAGLALLVLPTRDDRVQSIYLGDNLGDPGATTRAALGNRLGVTLSSTSLDQIIEELLVVHAREDGTRWRPLLPTHTGLYEVWLGRRISARPTQAQIDMLGVMLAGLGPRMKFSRREWLRAAAIAMGVLLLPRRTWATTLTESFNKADSTVLGPDLTWTEVAGDLSVVSNQANIVTIGGSVLVCARAETDLAGSDHAAQVTVTELSVNGAEVGAAAARFDAAAATFYSGQIFRASGDAGTCRTQKTIAGADTTIGTSTGVTWAATDTVKIEADGSTIRRYYNGSLQDTTTDTSIPGNTRCGICGFSDSGSQVKVDVFQAADLGGHILTEAGDCINAENSDRIIVESGGVPGNCLAGPAATTPLLPLLGVGS